MGWSVVMADKKLYFVIVAPDESWTIDLFVLFDEIVGVNPENNPCNDLHKRVRIDGLAAIYEARFNENAINPQAMRGRLTSASQIPPIKQELTESVTIYGDQWEYHHSDTSDFLMSYIIFNPDTWESSRQACLSYLSDNIAEWEPED